MEGLGWDDSQVFSNISSLWSNQENQETWIHASNSSSCIFSSKNMEITGDFFSNHQFHGFQKSRTSLMNANSDECQDTSKMVVDTSLEKSGASTQELLFSSSSLGNGFGMNNQSRIINGCLPVSTSSLYCLLSATNSNADTSVEDDMIFSDCRNLWSFGANSAAAASSGESENSTCNARNREMHHYLQETVSQNTSLDKRSYSQTTKLVHPKRTNDQTELKVSNFDLLRTDSTTNHGDFKLIAENQSKPKRPRSSNTKKPMSTNINFQQPSNSSASSSLDQEQDQEAIAQMKEMIYIAAAFRPVNLGLEIVEKPKRKNVKISTDPQTVAARQRRERISERIRVLQRLVPGGNKMDTATMLDEAANYLKFLISQVKALENLGHKLEVNYPQPPTNNIALSSLPFNMQPSAPYTDEMRW